MLPVIPALLGFGAYKLYRRWKKGSGAEEAAAVQCQHRFQVELPAHIGCVAVQEFFADLGYEVDTKKESFVFFQRGDAGIRKLPTSRRVGWEDIPQFVGVGWGPDGATLTVVVRRSSRPGLAMSESAIAFFREHAQSEADDLCTFMHRIADPPEPKSESRRRQHRWQPDPEPPRPSFEQEYAALGLKPGATWGQVQAAYRDCCLKYHPDRHSGNNVPPHLVELAVQRFKEITTAYQRLKEHLA